MPPLLLLSEPSTSTIERYARELNMKLFDGNKFRLTLSNVQWGYALLSVNAMKSTFE